MESEQGWTDHLLRLAGLLLPCPWACKGCPGAPMSIASIGTTASQSQSLGNLLLQQLNALDASSQAANATPSTTGDLLTVSPAAQQLAKVPDAVTKALTDLLSGQKDTAGDLAQLKAYFKQNPQGLASVLGRLQGDATTYGPGGSSDSRSTLLTALMNGQSNQSNPASLLKLLNGQSNQDSLFALMGDSGNGSDGASGSIFG